MPGAYASVVDTAVGKKLAAQLGLPRPARLRRYAVGEPLIDGPVLVGGHGEAPLAARVRSLLRGEAVDTVDEVASGILGQGFEPTPSYADCSMCDYRIACPAAER